jgi:hypothetical protein
MPAVAEIPTLVKQPKYLHLLVEYPEVCGLLFV